MTRNKACLLYTSTVIRSVAAQLAEQKDFGIVVNVSKGLEKGSLLRLSQVIGEEIPGAKIAVLSGPSHAEEVARNIPCLLYTSMAGMMLTMPLLSLFIGFTLPGGVAFYWACSSLIGGLIQVGVQQFYGPQKMLSRERLKELNKECDFEENQLKKIKTNQTLLNGEAAEK